MSEETGTTFEPLGDLVLVQIVREKRIGLIHTPLGSEALLKMQVLACQSEYVNHMGVMVPIKVRPGDFVVPRPDAAGQTWPIKLDEDKRAQAEANGAKIQGLLEDEIALIPYGKLAGIDRSGASRSPLIVKPEPKPKPGLGARGGYE